MKPRSLAASAAPAVSFASVAALDPVGSVTPSTPVVPVVSVAPVGWIKARERTPRDRSMPRQGPTQGELRT